MKPRQRLIFSLGNPQTPTKEGNKKKEFLICWKGAGLDSPKCNLETKDL